MSDTVYQHWSQTLQRLMEIPREESPSRIELDPDALSLFDNYREWLEPRIRAEGEGMQGWLSKLPGSVLRIAGLMHVVQHESPTSAPISLETIDDAIALGNYFHHHARIMFRMMYGRDGQSEAASILDVLETVDEGSITARDLWQRVKNRSGFDRDDLKAALQVLEEHGWIRQEKRTPPKGRPSEIIHLNPAIKSQKSRYAAETSGASSYETFETRDRGNVTQFNRSDYLKPTGTDGPMQEVEF